ncbi:MAG: hypothetical protein MO846_03900 [Candidatus Devosia symbiotica]|nr:hypothetical protein [Candidatus Devosia symbiotica]
MHAKSLFISSVQKSQVRSPKPWNHKSPSKTGKIDVGSHPWGRELGLVEHDFLLKSMASPVRLAGVIDERALASQTCAVVAALQVRLIDEADVRSFKIRHNGVLGYFVEVLAAHGARLLEEPHRQGV